MVQKRFWVESFDDIKDAYEAKKLLVAANPGNVYQVRKGRDGSKIKFRLVQRFQSSEANVINNEHTKRRNKRKPRPSETL